MKSRFRIFIVELLLGHLPACLRDNIFGIKRFWAKKRIFPQEQKLIFFTENGKWHGGFTDRMKGIITFYYLTLFFYLCKLFFLKIKIDL